MKSLLALLAICLTANAFSAEQVAALPKLPIHAEKNLPLLKKHLADKWPTYETPWYISAQVEQETCVSLKAPHCWSETVELKTSREYGFGLGQLTVAYDKNGKERFNAFNDVRKLDRDLANWSFDKRYDPDKQALAVVVRDKFEYGKIAGAPDPVEHSAFFFNSYNGGAGGMMQDRRLCASTKGCDSSKWFGNVERTSYKSRVVQKGYGKSFFDISREYPTNIIKIRSPKYKPYFDR
jgi:hypothetical protein